MKTVWIDLENSPHVPFFAPIIRELEQHGIWVLLTARNFAQTVALAEQHKLGPLVIGGEYGRETLSKVLGLSARALTLRSHLKPEKIDLAIGHGSRGMLLAAKLMRIPTLTLYDYEGASLGFFNRFSTWVMMPEVVAERLKREGRAPIKKLLTYPGMKENVYAREFMPDPTILHDLKIDPRSIVVLVRPPSDTAHYRAEESNVLFDAVMRLLSDVPSVTIVLSPRTREQRLTLEEKYRSNPRVRIPTGVFEGLNLIYHSDLVIGGGGTMNREAAALGVPVATLFKGPKGAIDAELIEEGRMIELQTANDIERCLAKRASMQVSRNTATFDAILSEILQLLTID